MKFFFSKRAEAKNGNGKVEAVKPSPSVEMHAEEDAREIVSAISLALHMHVSQMREFENTIITIQKVIKPYSPWSSKIYGLRQRPVCFRGSASRIK
ncbi:MAG: hypothetical protein JNK14_03840 [Chitinophagaceae bacterium]|nr:hypothetical protein [Chitinophagaceae bacterium]